MMPELKDVEGKIHHLSDYRGSILFLISEPGLRSLCRSVT